MIRFAGKSPRFQLGQLVRHKRYDYRGVVVAADQGCRGSEGWYRRNRAEPQRQQRWYHVLVAGTPTVTNAAGENLIAEPQPKQIEHPLVDEYFTGYEEGRDRRNEKPWFDG